MIISATNIPQDITYFIKNIPQFDTDFGLFYPQSVTFMIIFSPFTNNSK